jgi:hypothetical protein
MIMNQNDSRDSKRWSVTLSKLRSLWCQLREYFISHDGQLNGFVFKSTIHMLERGKERCVTASAHRKEREQCIALQVSTAMQCATSNDEISSPLA